MDLRSFVLVLSAVLLALSSFVFGWKFVKKRNYLLGIEMWVVGVSSSNAVVFFATESPVSYAISHFFDAFSRGLGMPVIAVLGMMTITHGFKPSIRFDVAAFVVSFAVTFFVLEAHFFEGILPYFLLVMSVPLSLYLAYVIKRLLGIGAVLQAVAVLLALVSCQAIAAIYDFYKIPGEETNVVFNFYTLALCTWAYLMPALHYAYLALERAQKRDLQFDSGHALDGLGRTSR